MATVTKAAPFMPGLRKWAYNVSGFNKYGLFYDDLLYETPDVEIALKRVCPKIIDERNYRIIRASQLSMQKIYLPETEWTKYEDDINNRYLSPIVEQVKRERLEKELWISEH